MWHNLRFVVKIDSWFETQLLYKPVLITANMNSLVHIKSLRLCANPIRALCTSKNAAEEIIEFTEDPVKIPEYVDRKGESLDVWRARLLYQARKRGTLENGILLSSFASKYLYKMDDKQLLDFDRLMNKPDNEWDIYYWGIGKKQVPNEYNHDVMKLFIEHCKNKEKVLRNNMPPLFT